ncbi:hypothetical protein FF011L_21380 [Roseimaritima multifibrata]|uniref:Right handed beta helix domain-containing protein n=1 Tax=Roseimaritima multifibrata TaxID=1930274 RepID=A0A517MEQ1_9BACT|nr:hypothetical protein [Roseimaritima multifibrata]QDS93375.1 hypothetical protein FF011L_21380 [Roseimaritima multifibrata]
MRNRIFILLLVAFSLPVSLVKGDATVDQETVAPTGNADSDTANLIAALSRARVVKLVDGATYKINQTIAIKTPVTITGIARVVSETRYELFQVFAADVAFRGVTFDGDGKSNYPGMIRVYKGADRFHFIECVIQNVHSGKRGVANLYPLWVSVDGVKDWSIRNCRFQNISNHGDGKPIGKGFVGAFRYGNVNPEGTQTGPVANPSSGCISGCTFRDIFTVTDNVNDTDADAIRASTGIASDNDVDVFLRVENCVFVDVQKSAVKAGNIGGVVIDSCLVVNRRTDFPMSFGFRTNLTTGFRVQDCEVRGNVVRAVYIGNGGPSFVSNLVFLPDAPVEDGDRYRFVADSAIQLGQRNSAARVASHAVIRGVYASNARSGVYCANCEWVTVSGVTLVKGEQTIKLAKGLKGIELSDVPSPQETVRSFVD